MNKCEEGVTYKSLLYANGAVYAGEVLPCHVPKRSPAVLEACPL